MRGVEGLRSCSAFDPIFPFLKADKSPKAAIAFLSTLPLGFNFLIFEGLVKAGDAKALFKKGRAGGGEDMLSTALLMSPARDG